MPVTPVFPGAPQHDELIPCNYVTAENLLEGDPQERAYIYLSTDDSSFTVGVWEAQPHSERIDSYPGDEFCHVIHGRLTLEEADGTSQTFTAGDSFTLKAGWAGVWKVEEPFMKYFAMSVPQQ